MAEVEVDKVLRLCAAALSVRHRHAGGGTMSGDSPMPKRTVRHKAAKVATNDAVPGRALALVKLYCSSQSSRGTRLRPASWGAAAQGCSLCA